MKLTQPVAEAYRGDLALAFFVVTFFLGVSSLTTDGGGLYQLIGAVTLVFCGLVTLILVRRPRNPTKVDLWLIRFGFFVLLPIVPAALTIGWKLRGL